MTGTMVMIAVLAPVYLLLGVRVSRWMGWCNMIGGAQLAVTMWALPQHVPALALVAVELASTGWVLWFTSHWRFARRNRWWRSPAAGRAYWRLRGPQAA